MNADDQRIFFVGIEITGVEEPGLGFEAAVSQAEAFGLAPGGLDGFVALRDLRPFGGWAGPNFGWRVEGAANDGRGFAIAGKRKIHAPSAGGQLSIFAKQLELG